MKWQEAKIFAAELARQYDGLVPGTPVQVIQYTTKAAYLRENPANGLSWQDHGYLCQALKREISRRKLKVHTVTVE
jgi:hypothetical protein